MAATTRHPCLLRAWETHVWRGEWWLALEWMDGGSATGLIEGAQAARSRLPEPLIAAVVGAVLDGLAHMHAAGRMHRDVKSDNVLVDRGGRVTLADFGFVADVGGGGHRTSTVGTPYWMAPELIRGGGYDARADVWSLGILALELAEYAPPTWTSRRCAPCT
ncbi:hypothetical protein BU14_0562s0018 [Porphyra umbilicalis]|uniref:Protein kinase domain-containing protein n=1 Tax=Porphyra umbilicalis TaxID=2786 RepID=A0A1X6NS38_PORUM|nr:hypothetical protein BU14_0562s0018 [Porphyra umbilicalis]|eukprot:OSX71306.1 hypothetical protein BU14_0562s0018 [Porphyra umbilicalis]